MIRVGIPNALFYYVYFPMWKVFFEELGLQVVTSGKTTKKLLDGGVREALADACVPVKVFFGHALSLKDKVDFLFIPRIVCLNKKTVFCPKFLGLPDMIRFGMENMPTVIDVRIDTRKKLHAIFSAYYSVGQLFNKKPGQIIKAYFKAKRIQKIYQEYLRKGLQPPEAIDLIFNNKKPMLVSQPGQLNFAIVGYPYIIHDLYISVDIVNKLRRMGVNVVTSDNLSSLTLKLQRCNTGKRLFWTFSERTLRAARYFSKQKNKLDGIIHLTAFGCGPDSIVDKFIQFDNGTNGIPFMSLSIDEHSGEAGMGTRLEAFVDMVRRKKRSER
ncbi:Predicted nucleotide-binding protein, sugar kinase/HSP70/actin superfamily [Desulfotomaculum arcticum]|uniref:Predicted nucleotide-binding protein, sugar kinase/HSP70/actin superfamily n=1 Tax=Desulfotruncus arcticus DSM 17038 TaxID=1121424 RepID=A0A1I2S2H6_9FIRM|nr:acyl-CoA dehydratase activase-related protein [Desulfotruncus arcticus]SFG47032.1 Predicted nucleotide-binding protein, sugar kinase/HSP70/actin superfamily [Desulfotomaculum arcticum] [Desulfotruncus arcticus DSM 17038]